MTCCNLSNKEDIWSWAGNRTEELNVAALRATILDSSNQHSSLWLLWNKWVTPKINIFCWRACLQRIPSKMGLNYRGIGVDNLMCSRCGLMEESVMHILWDCFFAKSVWRTIFTWVKITFPNKVSSVRKLLAKAEEMLWKKTIGAILQVAACEIWKARNEKTFNERQIHYERTMDIIKENSFLFICNRSKFCNLDWARWVDFNVRDVIV
ncbi:putative reverse transcriptase zinc-binding domain-containing protein [Helianthus annuus]|nr:putative reverse transcriptase zinc-binding domain-containing protein [Helianthus annuus]